MVITKDLEGNLPHQCSLGEDLLSTSGPWPDGFTKFPSSVLIRIVIDRILKNDAIGVQGFLAGNELVYTVPYSAPFAPFTDEYTTVDDYRNKVQSIGALVRVLLLDTPSTEHLYPFQVSGVEWLKQQNKRILADDMGLGKTLQAITAMSELFHEGLIENALVVAPRSLVTNWEQELAKWAPELSRMRIIAPTRIRDEVWRFSPGKTHVLLTTYEQFRGKLSSIIDYKWDLVVIDEAHRIRNIKSQVSKGLSGISASRFWALTGTPIERDTEDLWTLLYILDRQRFYKRDKHLPTSVIRASAREYILRRMKKDVLTDLPEKLEIKQSIELLPKQKLNYQKEENKLRTANDESILPIINRLLSICDFDKDAKESAKIERIVEIVSQIILNDEKVVVFSHLRAPLLYLKERLLQEIPGTTLREYRGDMSRSERDKSIDDFKNNPDIRIILCSSKIAAEGLTLVAANNVIFLNQWWNPSANNQGMDRVYRIGQDKDVNIYTFVCKDTLEEHLEKILRTKSNIIGDVVDELAVPGSSADKPGLMFNLGKEIRDLVGGA